MLREPDGPEGESIRLDESVSAPLLRLMNARSVFNAIWEWHPISRAEIARRLRMAKPTVSNLLQELVAAGLVRETPLPEGVVRQRGITFEPVPTAAFVLGLDVGGRFLRAALADLSGEVVAREDAPHTDVVDGVLPDMALRLRDDLLARADEEPGRLAAVVVGMPGILNPRTGKLRKVNPVRVEAYPIAQALERSLGHPAIVENDVNLAALGEQWRGLGQGVGNFAFLSIGTGVGTGLVLDGKLHRGSSGAAGEIDMPGDPESPAGHALRSFAHELYGGSASTIPEIFASAERGEAAAVQVVREEARRIAACIVPIARVSDVELVVLGGGIGSHCGGILDDIRAHLDGRVHYPPRVELSALGDAPVLTGALAMGTSSCRARIVAHQLQRQGREQPDLVVEGATRER